MGLSKLSIFFKENLKKKKGYKEHLGFQAGSTTITRSALVSVRPKPPTWDVKRNMGAPTSSWKS